MELKKYLLKTILILSWIVLSTSYTHSQDSSFGSEFAPIGKYTIDRWKAIKLIEDAYKKRIQDTLIDSLQARIKLLESDRISTYNSFADEMAAERAKTKVQSELVTYESSLKEMAKHNAKIYKRQRNWLLGGLGLIAGYSIKQVLKPP